MSADAELRRRIASIITEMEPLTREVFLMHCPQDIAYGEIAEHLGIPVADVESRLVEALVQLADGLRTCERQPD